MLSTARKSRRSEFKREFAKDLRAAATEAERKLWSLLRNRRLGAFKFRRQHPMGPYIADFFCAAAKLIVELDGDQHGGNPTLGYDAARTRWLETRGYRVLRFGNLEFLRNSSQVLEQIWRVAIECTPPRTAFGGSTLPQGEGGEMD